MKYITANTDFLLNESYQLVSFKKSEAGEAYVVTDSEAQNWWLLKHATVLGDAPDLNVDREPKRGEHGPPHFPHESGPAHTVAAKLVMLPTVAPAPPSEAESPKPKPIPRAPKLAPSDI